MTGAAERAAAAAPLPLVVIGGYLGAGKTTLVNHLLRHADGRRIAVLVNDFGEVSIDADLIDGDAATAGEVLSLAGGCVCCSFGADLVGALAGVCRREPRPDLVLVETSGVALPAAVARSARLVPGVVVDGVVVVVDAVDVRARAADRHVGDLVRQQLHEADLLLLNKLDGIAAVEARALQCWLDGLQLTAPRVAAAVTAVALAAVLGRGRLPPARAAAGPARAPSARPAGDLFAAEHLSFAQPQDVEALVRRLRLPESGVVRAKGVLQGLDGRWWTLQLVGRRAELRAVDGGPRRAAGAGRLSMIRLREAAAPSLEGGVGR